MKYCILILALAYATTINAQDYNLYVRTSQNETGYEVRSIQKITNVNGKIVITKKDGTQSQFTPLSDITKMYFSTVPVAIRDTKQDATPSDNAPAFNLQGVRVTPSYKGVVIKNGKKTIQN